MTQKSPIVGDEWNRNRAHAIELLKNKTSFLFAGDIDPDSVGSMLSLGLFLRLQGKRVYMVISNSLGENLDYFQNIIEFNQIHVVRKADELIPLKGKIDVIIFCDTANTKLVPFYSELVTQILVDNPDVIEIDHHFGADSEKVTSNGVQLFRKANANTEIIGELLDQLTEKGSELPNPFNQRNILLALITGLLGDTVGGKVVHYREDYDFWIKRLGDQLEKHTRWRDATETRPADSRQTKFGNPFQLLQHLNRLSPEQDACLNFLTDRVFKNHGIGLLNLMNSTYPEVGHVCQPYQSDWFQDILGFLVNLVPEQAGKVGILLFHGKNAEGKDCIFIKIRRAVDYDGIDLRRVEDHIRSAFDGKYMGGGGHPGAVSFRIHPDEEDEVLARFHQVTEFLRENMT